MHPVAGDGRLEKRVCIDHAGGAVVVPAETKNAGKWHNHIIRRFNINPDDRLYDQGDRGCHPYADIHHQKYCRHRLRH